MDLNAALVILPLALMGMGAVIWWAWQRQIRNSDEADKAHREKVDARLEALESRSNDMRLEVEKRITRDELEKVFSEVSKVREQVTAQGQETIKALATLVAGLRGGNNG